MDIVSDAQASTKRSYQTNLHKLLAIFHSLKKSSNRVQIFIESILHQKVEMVSR